MTTKGDKTQDFVLTVNDSFLNIQPGIGEEWSIHNIYWGGAAEIYATDGTNDILVGSSETSGARLNNYLNCTSTQYFRIKNISGSSVYLGYDGVITKGV